MLAAPQQIRPLSGEARLRAAPPPVTERLADLFLPEVGGSRRAAGFTRHFDEVTMGKGSSPKDAQNKKP